MNDNNQLLQTAWQFWHAGTGIDTEDMPPPNPSFKAGFDYGMVAAHNEHCAALIRVEELSSDAKKTECPCRDKCLRYTDKSTNPEYTSMMNAPKIRKSGCQLKIEVNK